MLSCCCQSVFGFRCLQLPQDGVHQVKDFSCVFQVSELGTVLLLVKGMTCASCVGSIESGLKGLPGVTDVQVNLMSGQARVEHDPKVRWVNLVR